MFNGDESVPFWKSKTVWFYIVIGAFWVAFPWLLDKLLS
jgi:hypothetical protein